MKLARVIGTIVSTIQHSSFDGHRLMLCTYLTPEGYSTGKQEIAVDLVQSGVGDRVLIMSEGNGVRQLLGTDAGPIRDVIVGIVDEVTLDSTEAAKMDHRKASTEVSTDASTISLSPDQTKPASEPSTSEPEQPVTERSAS